MYSFCFSTRRLAKPAPTPVLLGHFGAPVSTRPMGRICCFRGLGFHAACICLSEYRAIWRFLPALGRLWVLARCAYLLAACHKCRTLALEPFCMLKSCFCSNENKLSVTRLFDYPSSPPAPLFSKLACQRGPQQLQARSSRFVKSLFIVKRLWNIFVFIFYCSLPHYFSYELRIKTHFHPITRCIFFKKNFRDAWRVTLRDLTQTNNKNPCRRCTVALSLPVLGQVFSRWQGACHFPFYLWERGLRSRGCGFICPWK